ncbi:MAG: oxidoreductase [Solirubrobacteraceae bacterium]
MPGGWTAAEIPDLAGRTAIVTGANSGLGLITVRELARHGADVILACRDRERGQRALAEVQAVAPDPSQVRLEQLDLADLASVRQTAARIVEQLPRVDLLVNNAGIMAAPRRETVDGFESQFATNHLGHFALTGLLLGSLQAAPRPRVVTVTSGVHRIGRIAFGDLQRERRYNRWLAYAQSKLANLLFCFELQRRAVAARSPLLSLAAHPGAAATNLQSTGPQKPLERALLALGNRTVSQSASMGALPSLYAATSDSLPGGVLVGPDGFMEGRGHPRVVGASRRAYDEADARRLWEESERLTGVHYRFTGGDHD